MSPRKSGRIILITTYGGSPVTRTVMGGTTEQLLHASPVPLLAVPSWTDRAVLSAKVKRILVPVDGSDASESILPLAREHDAKLILDHVETGPPGTIPSRISEMERRFNQRIRPRREEELDVQVVVEAGAVPDKILETA